MTSFLVLNKMVRLPVGCRVEKISSGQEYAHKQNVIISRCTNFGQEKCY